MSSLRKLLAKFMQGDAVYARTTMGGIKPPPHKHNSLRSRIMATPIPEHLAIPIGPAPSGLSATGVKVGERVLKYQMLSRYKQAGLTGDESGQLAVPIHAPTSGIVTAIAMAAVAEASVQERLCIHLSSDGLDEALPLQSEKDYHALTPPELFQKIAAAGIIGMGGAGFAVARKLHLAAQQEVDLVIINAAECEPYITADEALIRERAVAVLLGSDIIKLACAAKRCVLAIEDSKLDAIAALEDAINSPLLENANVELRIVPSKYPAGSEKQLIQCLTGLEVPAGQYPTDIGIIMQNAGTAHAVFAAVVEGKPCISRITTLTGNALQTPKNFDVLIGTSTNFLFDLCGINRSTKVKSIVGGSLMGHELFNDDAVVNKTTNCLIAGTVEEFPGIQPEQACIRCGYCANACPVNLLPQQLYAFSDYEDSNQLIQHGLFDCIECGACDYVCPSHIPLVSHFRQSKNSINAHRLSMERSQQWQQRFQYHQYRIKKDKDQALGSKDSISAQESVEFAESFATETIAEQESFSKEKASREIAAAVARVKARRSKIINGDPDKDEPPSGDSN